MGENYLNRLKKYDSFLEREIESGNKSVANLSELVGKGAIVGDATIAEASEKLKNYNDAKIELYKIFPELEDYSKIIDKNLSSNFDKHMVE